MPFAFEFIFHFLPWDKTYITALLKHDCTAVAASTHLSLLPVSTALSVLRAAVALCQPQCPGWVLWC